MNVKKLIKNEKKYYYFFCIMCFSLSAASAQTFYELELVIAYQADMTATDIANYNASAVVQRANEILCATSMTNNVQVIVIETVSNTIDFPTGTRSFDAMLHINANGNSFSLVGDKALYITNVPFLPLGGPTTEHLYGDTWNGSPNFPQNCNNRTMLMVNQNSIETHARLLVRYIGKSFSALSILNQTQGIFHFDAGQMTDIIDAANAMTIGVEIPKSYANDPINYPQCMDIITVIQSTYYVDSDSDGYGDITNSILACITPAGYVSNSADCDDNDTSIFPGAMEVCGDGVDNNCDGLVDEGCVLNPCDSYANPTLYIDNSQLPGIEIYVDKNLILNDFSLSQNTEFHAGTLILLSSGYDSGLIGIVSSYEIEDCN